MMNLKTNKSLFITFEGGEGCGKSTQIKRLVDYFISSSSIKFIQTREPGGCPSAEILRELIVKSQANDWQPLTELLLLLGSRIEHLKNVIQPALQNGIHVICDRFSDSTFAYQGYAREMNLELIHSLHQLLKIDIKPDRTYFLDIKPEIGLKRSKNRLKQSSSKEDRFEDLDLDFHHKIYNGFHKIIEQDPQRFCVIDASLSENQVHAIIVEDIKRTWGC